MRPLGRDEVRTSIDNLPTPGAKVHLPGTFDRIRWDRLDYLGWRDMRAPQRAYLVLEVDGRARGLLLTQHPKHAEHARRAVMCDLCRTSRRFNEVAFFVAGRPSRDKRRRLSTVGLLLCVDLDCSDNVRRLPLPGPHDPPEDEVLARRRSGLRARTLAFWESVTAPVHAPTRKTR